MHEFCEPCATEHFRRLAKERLGHILGCLKEAGITCRQVLNDEDFSMLQKATLTVDEIFQKMSDASGVDSDTQGNTEALGASANCVRWPSIGLPSLGQQTSQGTSSQCNSGLASLLTAAPLAEALDEFLDYDGGADNALEDPYVVERAKNTLTQAEAIIEQSAAVWALAKTGLKLFKNIRWKTGKMPLLWNWMGQALKPIKSTRNYTGAFCILR